MSSHVQCRGKAKTTATATAAIVGWAAVLWIAFSVGPYLYAFNDLVSWR